MSSTFPEQIDSIPDFLDVTNKDGELIKKFEQYMYNNDFSNANQILNQIENADQKIISASRMNKLRDCIIAIENFYKSNVENYIIDKQNQWKTIIEQFKYVGEYSSEKNYKINNIVIFESDGEDKLFIRTNGDDVINKSPLDSNYWRVLTIKGERGISTSEETTFYFDWISNQTYAINAIVSHNNRLWISKKENINSEPSEENINWELIMSAVQVLYPIQKEKPIFQTTGELWFEVI